LAKEIRVLSGSGFSVLPWMRPSTAEGVMVGMEIASCECALSH